MIKNLEDNEICQSNYPSDGMKLTVEFPHEPFACGAASMHPNELKETPKDAHLDTFISFRKEWKIDGGVLPHQGIVFWWRLNGKE